MTKTAKTHSALAGYNCKDEWVTSVPRRGMEIVKKVVEELLEPSLPATDVGKRRMCFWKSRVLDLKQKTENSP